MCESENPSKPIHKGDWRPGDSTDDQRDGGQSFLDTYKELMDKYDERNLLFFVWEFAEQTIRLIILTFVPPLINAGGSPLALQLLLLVFFTLISLIVLICRFPYREVNANYLKIVGKFMELGSFALLILAAILPFAAGTDPDSLTSLVMWLNIAYVYLMLLNTLKDNIIMAK